MQEISVYLYPGTLLNSLISSTSFLGAYFRIFCVLYHVIYKQWQFYFSFPIYITFISFSSLIALARTSKSVLSNSGENGHPCLVLDLRGNAFSFSLLRMMLAVGLLFVVFIMLEFVFSIPTFWRVFIINRCWILFKAFSAFVEMILWLLFFYLLMWCIILIDVQLKNPCIPSINPNWSWCVILLIYCWIQIASIFCWGFLCLCSSVIVTYKFFFW